MIAAQKAAFNDNESKGHERTAELAFSTELLSTVATQLSSSVDSKVVIVLGSCCCALAMPVGRKAALLPDLRMPSRPTAASRPGPESSMAVELPGTTL